MGYIRICRTLAKYCRRDFKKKYRKMGETMYQENGKRKKSGFVSEKKDEDQKHY